MPDAPPAAPFVAEVEALAPLIRAHADENERERRLATPVVEALLDRQLFRVMLPARLGGGDLSNDEAMPISLNPFTIRVVEDGEGYRVSGRLTYASGVHQCTRLVAAGTLHRDRGPVVGPSGTPMVIGCIVPAAEGTVLDTWRPTGLAGTGSHDVEIASAFVPRAHTFELLSTAPKPEDPLAAIPLPTRLSAQLVAVGVGIVRRAIDKLVELGGRRPFASPRLLRERGSSQVDLGRACGLVEAARAHVENVMSAVFAKVRSGDAPTLADLVRLRLAYVTATESLVRAVDLVRAAAGMAGIATGSTLERCWRDVHTLAQHFSLSSAQLERMGRIRFGLEPGPGPI